LKGRRLLRFGYNWSAQICDPLRAMQGLRGLWWYFADYCAYKSKPGAEPMRLLDLTPALQERSTSHALDTHYFYVNAWAMRRIIANHPTRHVDIASLTVLASLLSAIVPVIYLDYRLLKARLGNLECVGGSILALPYKDGSIESLSCLHVAEHIGLGRYGDPLDPYGTKKAACELTRVLAPGGNLFFALPIGMPRLCFNAHRIHSAKTICEYFSSLVLVEYSGVHDNGCFVEGVQLSEFQDSEYACGMFWFQKPSHE